MPRRHWPSRIDILRVRYLPREHVATSRVVEVVRAVSFSFAVTGFLIRSPRTAQGFLVWIHDNHDIPSGARAAGLEFAVISCKANYRGILSERPDRRIECGSRDRSRSRARWLG